MPEGGRHRIMAQTIGGSTEQIEQVGFVDCSHVRSNSERLDFCGVAWADATRTRETARGTSENAAPPPKTMAVSLSSFLISSPATFSTRSGTMIDFWIYEHQRRCLMHRGDCTSFNDPLRQEPPSAKRHGPYSSYTEALTKVKELGPKKGSQFHCRFCNPQYSPRQWDKGL